ncbi:hypothetical protein LDENG_00016810 [Lucifuga dentata]|nr:hypothetical protein LDENG_00016810 [Lucifuga dentata]
METTGRVDNRNYYERKSLSREKRQLELLRISKENQVILFRLSLCRPHYNVRSWHEDWLTTLKVMDSIARYPRGRGSKQEQGQEKSSKRNNDCDNEKKINRDETAASNKTNKAAAGPEIMKKPEEGTAHLAPKPRTQKKSVLPDISKKPCVSDTIKKMTPDRSEISNNPHTLPKLGHKCDSPTQKQETRRLASTEEG